MRDDIFVLAHVANIHFSMFAELFKDGFDMGLGREDFAAIMEIVRASAMKAAMK